MPNISKDFMNLSRAVSENNDEAIRYELVNILANCLDDATYKKEAEANIVAYVVNEAKIKEQLRMITEAIEEDYKFIQPIADDFFKKITTAASVVPSSISSQQTFFKEPLSTDTFIDEELLEEMLVKLTEHTIQQLRQINQETKINLTFLQRRYQEKVDSELQKILPPRNRPEKV